MWARRPQAGRSGRENKNARPQQTHSIWLKADETAVAEDGIDLTTKPTRLVFRQHGYYAAKGASESW